MCRTAPTIIAFCFLASACSPRTVVSYPGARHDESCTLENVTDGPPEQFEDSFNVDQSAALAGERTANAIWFNGDTTEVAVLVEVDATTLYRQTYTPSSEQTDCPDTWALGVDVMVTSTDPRIDLSWSQQVNPEQRSWALGNHYDDDAAVRLIEQADRPEPASPPAILHVTWNEGAMSGQITAADPTETVDAEHELLRF